MKTPIMSVLTKAKAIIVNDHIVYTSGLHGSVYINKDALYPLVGDVSAVGKLFAQKYAKKRIEVVVGPALGGIILSQWTAYHLSRITRRLVLSVYTEKALDNNQILTRGYDQLVKQKRVLIVEDITTTGGSVKKVVRTVAAAGGVIIGVCAMINRNPLGVGTKTIGAPFSSLGVLPAEAYPKDNCPLCEKGVPVNTTVGHGKSL